MDSDTDDSNHDDSYCSALLSDTHEKSTIFVNGSNNVHKATEDLLDLVRVSVRVRVILTKCHSIENGKISTTIQIMKLKQ